MMPTDMPRLYTSATGRVLLESQANRYMKKPDSKIINEIRLKKVVEAAVPIRR
jgi:hypothetical protein